MVNNYVHPLRIFISSVMENKNEPWREKILNIRYALNKSLKRYPFIDSYILEEDDPSIMPLEEAYLTPLRDSNLIIFILDSHYPIPSGVQVEITESRRLNIPRIYCIIPGEVGEAEAMKDELLHQQESNYIQPLAVTNDYPQEIENVIFKQLINVFKAYEQKKTLVTPEDGNVSDSATGTSTIIATSAQFNKKMFQKMGLSKQYVRRLIFHEEPEHTLINPQSEIDQSVIGLLERLFENKPLPFYWNNTMVEAIKTVNPTALSDEFILVLEQRLKAVMLFFSDKYIEASECLKELLKKAKFDRLPSWILQDILIDLRNLLVIEDEFRNRFHPDNIYQTKLNDSATPFYYPGIDHSLKTVYEWVRSEQNKHNTSSSSEENMYGLGIYQYADALTEAEIFAACNGSITQMRQLPNYLNILSEMFLQHYGNRIYLRDVIQNQLLMGKSYKTISRWIKKYSFLQGQFTDNDAVTVLSVVESFPVKVEKIGVQATTLRIFGDYLTDTHFKENWTKLFKSIKSWLGEPQLIFQPATEILGLFRYCFRIPQDDIIFTITKLAGKFPRYFDQLTDIISGAIDYENANVAQRQKIINALFSIVKASKTVEFIPEIQNALVATIASWPKETKALSTYLKENRNKYFEQDILPYTWNDTTDSKFDNYIDRQISIMKSQNEGQNGKSVSMYGVNPFINIYDSISRNFLINERVCEEILQEIVNTLNNPHQTIDTKKSAVKLMMRILLRDENQYSVVLKNINTEIFLAESLSLFEISTPTQYIEVLRAFIEISLSREDNGKLLLILTLAQSANYIYFVSELLLDFIPLALQDNSLTNTIPQILQFLIANNNSHERENKLINNVSKCFLILVNHQQYSDVALGQLQRLVSDTNNIVQRQLVSYIHSLPVKQQDILKGIKDQLVVSSSYSVRDLAIRDFR